MSKIFEVFGFPLESNHPDAISHREQAKCPFSGIDCDGGGNRYLSALQLEAHSELAKRFPDRNRLQVGVCSLLIRDKPWIVCPRRLLVLGSSGQIELQKMVRGQLVKRGGLSSAQGYRVWSEVKVKTSIQSAGENITFDYTFDYVVASSCRKSVSEVAEMTGMSENVCERLAEENQFTLASRDGRVWIDDFPGDPIVIVEIMTCSTSGGNKGKRTQIGMAFEDAILKGKDHEGPGINYRQVWARMASQLVAKSQIGLAWGGRTVWILQDVFADYISSSTGLDIHRYLSETADEVNVLAFGYEESRLPDQASGVVLLENSQFFSGPISTGSESLERDGFVDIIKVRFVPPKEILWRSLFRKSPCGAIQ